MFRLQKRWVSLAKAASAGGRGTPALVALGCLSAVALHPI